MTSHPVRIDDRELALSNLDKVMYPETGFIKGQVIDFYTEIAPYILPHLKDRPITLKRYPNGVQGEHFYEKDAPSFTPRWIKRFPIPRTSVSGVINYILINDLATLVWSANMANLEIHPFLARVPEIDHPTMIVFDLDPGDGATIINSCEVAFLLKELLNRLELKSFAKVSGSKGIHIHVPLNTDVTYDMTQAFAQSVAQYLASEHPDLIVSEMAKAKRRRNVFIDWSQNSEYKSTVAVYSLRAKAERPFVAMPVRWDELKAARTKNDPSRLFFEPQPAIKRMKRVGDLFAESLTLEQTLPKPFLDIGADNAVAANASMGSLEPYRRKRDFTKTREPAPSLPRPSRQGSRRLFVIQKHAASHLHYDFRLEMAGTLKSWALPKGPPYDLNERRLAMATEDHPMEYANFEGTIPAGEYGGGTVMVWDTGTYELIDGNYWQGKLHVFLNGKKLVGEWVLVKGEDRDGKGNVWYMIKAAAGFTRLSESKDNASALTGRSMEQIGKDQDAVWHSNRSKNRPRQQSQPELSFDIDSLPSGRIGFIEPMLAASAAALPHDSAKWSYEIKLDGYRCIAAKDENESKLYSRKRNLLNERFPGVVKALAGLEAGTVLDGEIVALDEHGRPSFNLLQNFSASRKNIYFYVFDLLLYRSKELINLPIEQRRDLLRQLAGALPDTIRMSEDFDGLPAEIIAAAQKLALEGVIAKKRGSVYQPGKRTGTWLKYKINKSRPFVIGGYTPGKSFDALIVGYYEGDDLMFAAKVRNGFVPHVRQDVWKQLAGLETAICPFANLPEKRRTQWALTAGEMKNCRWLEPKLVGQFEFTEWTPDGHLRAAKFVGLRDDKNVHEIIRQD